jgi:hypothetical protein
MDSSSKLALSIGNKLESMAQAEEDRQQHPQLHPVQKQAERLKANVRLPALAMLGARPFCSRSAESRRRGGMRGATIAKGFQLVGFY